MIHPLSSVQSHISKLSDKENPVNVSYIVQTFYFWYLNEEKVLTISLGKTSKFVFLYHFKNYLNLEKI